MSARQISRGTCVYCGNTYAKSGIARHLKACPARKTALAKEEARRPLKTRLFHLAVEGQYNPDYWLHLEVPASATLFELDRFLRDIWLECCGHLSMFQIQGQNFMVQVFDDWWAMDDRDMNVALDEVLTPGLKFLYEYDFGSSTNLALKVVSDREGAPRPDDPVELLARNEPPDYRCDRCGKPAVYVDVFEDYTLLCETCDETGGDGEGLLPVVNSPRVGVCGYTGDA